MGAAHHQAAVGQQLDDPGSRRLRLKLADVETDARQLGYRDDETALLQAGNTTGNRKQVWADLANLYDKLRLRVRLEVIAHD